MFGKTKKDPLVDAVTKVMKEADIRYRVEQKLCEELGIYSKNALPNEHKVNYDALLEQRINEALHPNQQKLDVHEPEKDKLTADDFTMLRSKKKMPQGPEYAEKRRMDEEEDGEETREGGAVVDTKTNKPVVSTTAPRSQPSGPTSAQRDALTNKIKQMKEAMLAGPETGSRKTPGSNQVCEEEQIDEAVPLPPRRPQTGRAGTASQPRASNPRGDVVTGIERTGGGEYNKYKKDSTSASEFQNIYGAARKSGSGSFEWQGRKYTTGQKGGAYVKPADQAAAENKPGSGSTTALNQLPKDPNVEASRTQTPTGRPDPTAMPAVQRALRGDKSPENNTELDNATRTTAAARLIAPAARRANQPAPGQTGGEGPLVSNPGAPTLGQQAAASRQRERAMQAAAPDPEKIDEVAKSEKQREAAGAALATQGGRYAGGKKGGAINRMALMKPSDLVKLARKKKAEKVDEDFDINAIMEEIRANLGEEAFAALMAEQEITAANNPYGYGRSGSKFVSAIRNIGGLVGRGYDYLSDRTSARGATPTPGTTQVKPGTPAPAPAPAQKGGSDISRAPNSDERLAAADANAFTPKSIAAAAAQEKMDKRNAERERADQEDGANMRDSARNAERERADQEVGANMRAAGAPAPGVPAPAPGVPAPAAGGGRAGAPAPEPASKQMFQAAQDRASSGENDTAAFFRADKQLQRERGMMQESLESTIRKMIK